MEWTPMELNAETLNKMMCKLGVGESWRFVDVMGLEGDPLCDVRKPCCALILLFPLTQQHEAFRAQQADKVSGGSEAYFLKQTAVNSCGTIALRHAPSMTFDGASALKKFLDETANMSPDDRAKQLEKNQAICEAHNEIAAQGQCQPQADKVNFHIIAFVDVNGQLYEFDGKMNGPVNHGPTKEESFIKDSANICGFMEMEKGGVRFSAVALCRSWIFTMTPN